VDDRSGGRTAESDDRVLHPFPPLPRRAAGLAIGLVSAFIAVLAVLVVAEPEIDPTWRWISEYELGHIGWAMSLAFFLWGAGAASLLVAVRPFLHSRIARGWLLLMAVSLVGAGIFRTDPTVGGERTTAGQLHDVFGMFTVFTFPIMATVLASSLARDPAWAGARKLLFRATSFTWLAPASLAVTVAVSVAVTHAPSGFGPQVAAGWPNRLTAISYAGWLICVASHLVRSRREE
jgi:hypothetical protein